MRSSLEVLILELQSWRWAWCNSREDSENDGVTMHEHEHEHGGRFRDREIIWCYSGSIYATKSKILRPLLSSSSLFPIVGSGMITCFL